MTIETGLKDSILIVDDTPTNLEVISQALSYEGYKVAIATCGERALQQVKRRQPALILLDVMMPGIDGFETCKQLKADQNTCHIPVIFMTALADTESKIKGLSLGAVDYITKPFQAEEVLARVKTHLQLHLLTQHLEREVERKTAELRDSQLQVIQQEKMSALGNLVAGVAHEINNPLGFIYGNINEAINSFADIVDYLVLCQKKYSQIDPELQHKAEEIELEYLLEDLPKIFTSIKLGCDRLNAITNSLRTFSRADQDYKIPFDIHEGINTTILILKHRLKANKDRPEIEVITAYDDLPNIECFPGQLNQVFMNIIANAIDALEESNIGKSFNQIQQNHNQIIIKTILEDEQVLISIRDNGIGMDEEIKNKIFDQLFTTKTVDKGTGLGLAIAKQIIEEKHQGSIIVKSQKGAGTEFIICLPVKVNYQS